MEKEVLGRLTSTKRPLKITMKNQFIIEHYKKYGVSEGDKLLLETAKNNFQKGRESRNKEILEIIDKCDKYPSDVFPYMDKLQLRKIDIFMKETFGFPLDRLSAHLMRLAQENIKEILIQQLTEEGKE